MSNFIVLKNTPKGIRTPVASVKGRCPRPLDDGGEATVELIQSRPWTKTLEKFGVNRKGPHQVWADDQLRAVVLKLRVGGGVRQGAQSFTSLRSASPVADVVRIWPFQTGTVQWKQAPSPGSDTTQMRPPWTWAIRRHTDSPTP